jgi:DNA (cytosine-5)-methyltransferase 1
MQLTKSKLTVIDFFCGAGGFSEGFRQAGFDIIWAIDNWSAAVDTHNENHSNTLTICDDVIRISSLPDKEFDEIIPDSDVIIGSPPCTFFSNSNKSGNGDKSKGLELILAYFRIVARKKYKKNSILKYWLLENVPKVQTHIKEKYTARELGIDTDFILNTQNGNSGEYNAKYYGVPSNRIRYFCGDFPAPRKVIRDDKDLIRLKKILDALGAPKQKLHTFIIDPIYGVKMKGEEVTDHHYIQQLSVFEKTKLIRLKQDKGYMGRMAVPENPGKPARTIMATMSFTSRECFVLGYEKNNLRAPTIREVASLMSFPIDYRFYGSSLGTKYRMVGNAVPPKLSFAFAKAIMKKEGKRTPTKYTPIKHVHKVGFINLNLDEIPIKEEKPKKRSAKFKYHIPYFKFETYRVELTNSHSDFEQLRFKWDAEIHYNQGKDKAKIYTPHLDDIPIEKIDLEKINSFFKTISRSITSFNEFQKIHCMTMQEISKRKLMGPFEFLNSTKNFINKEFRFTPKNNEIIKLNEAPYEIPAPIAIGYYLVSKFINLMAEQNEKSVKNKGTRRAKKY